MKTRKRIPVFWGCTITNRLPFIEKTTRRVLDVLGYEPLMPEGLSCCPDPVYGRGMDEDQWLALAARNLAICKGCGDDLLVPCNGCLATFKKATHDLKDRGVRQKVNEQLETVALGYESPPNILHILSFLEKIGPDRLKEKFLYSLGGLKLGVHYGCHISNTPALAIGAGESTNVFEELLAATGLEVPPYKHKNLCCGASTAPSDPEGSHGLLRQKFRSAVEAGLDALVVCCPLCFIQFDMEAHKLEKNEVLPVFYITEILALAMGIPEKELRLDWHANKPHPLLNAKLTKSIRGETVESLLDLDRLRHCCGACTYECSSARGYQDNDLLRFDPMAIVQKVLAGKIEEALQDPEIWRCLKCHECATFCPCGDGLAPFFESLQKLAMQLGYHAEPMEQKVSLIRNAGLGIPKNAAIRKEFDLPAFQAIEKRDLEKLIERPDAVKSATAQDEPYVDRSGE
jgi:heterodisulfide reductase subunit B